MVGAPLVGLFAVLSLRGKGASDEPAGPPTTGGVILPSTDAIGVGQLAEFESLVTARLNDQSTMIAEGQLASSFPAYPTYDAPAPSPTFEAPSPTPSPTASTPAPSRPGECSSFPADLRARMHAGEYPIGPLNSRSGSGCWYASNYGGVFAYGAPFYGSGFGAYGIGPPNDRRIVAIRANPNHADAYELISERGESYRFPVGT